MESLRCLLIPRKHHIVACVIFLLTLSQNFKFSSSTATLKVTFLTYNNPTGRDWYNEPCDLVFNTECDNLFDICLDRIDGNDDVGSCQYLSKNTGEFRNHDNIQFVADMYGVANPMIVNMQRWRNVLLKVRVRDDDSHSNHDLVDRHWYKYSATPGFNNRYNSPSSPLILGNRTRTHKTSLHVQFSVKCDLYYYRNDCGKYCRARDDDTNGHYRCSNTGDKQCLPGWEDADSNCMVRSDDCLRHGCKNGATCVDGIRTYTCRCAPGYKGNRCDEDIDECLADPCQNGGTCTDLINGYTCSCPSEFPRSLSADCSMHSCSHTDPCENGATCYGTGKCICPPNYTGLRCEMTFCQSNCVVCHNGGTCTGSECVCPPGVYGKMCEVDLCDHITCFNGGICSNGTCSCPEGYQGDYCQELVDNCMPFPCLNGGYCINQLKGYTCLCKAQYTGERCDTEIPKPTTTEKPIEAGNDLNKGPPPEVGDQERHTNDFVPEPVSHSTSTPNTMFMAMIICMVILLVIIIVLILMLCRNRIDRKRKQILADRDREATMSNFDNPVYTLERSRQQARANMYDDARYMQPVGDNEANAIRYAETMQAGGATGTRVEPTYDYPKGGKDPLPVMDHVYDHPRPLAELQQPPPYSPPTDPHYANALAGADGAVSMNDLKVKLEDEPQYEDIQALKKAMRKE